MALLSNSFTFELFGLTNTAKPDVKQGHVNKLKGYRVVEVTVGVPYYKKLCTNAEAVELTDQLWRQILCSCELGLHLSRTDTERNAFNWLTLCESK